MGKSMKSKWKRKMRAIKREGMEVKVLARLKNMLATAEAEKSLIPLPSKEELKKRKKTQDGEVEMGEVPETSVPPENSTQQGVMDIEGEAPKKKRKASLKTMKNADGKYPDWMSVKKIRQFKRAAKMKKKRCSKEAKMARNWRIANSN